MKTRTFAYKEALLYLRPDGFLAQQVHSPKDKNADAWGFVWIVVNPVTLNAMSEECVLI